MAYRRAYHIAFDVLMFVLQIVLFDYLVAHWNEVTFQLYLPVYLTYCAGLYFKRYDERYLAGLRWFHGRNLFWVISFYALQTTVGAMAFGSCEILLGIEGRGGLSALVGLTALVLVFPLSLAVMIYLAVQSKRIPPALSPGRRKVYQLVSDVGIGGMGTILLSFFHHLRSQVVTPLDLSLPGILGAVVLASALGILFYFPARFHYVLEEPKDKANWRSFVLVMVLFAIYLVLGKKIVV